MICTIIKAVSFVVPCHPAGGFPFLLHAWQEVDTTPDYHYGNAMIRRKRMLTNQLKVYQLNGTLQLFLDAVKALNINYLVILIAFNLL